MNTALWIIAGLLAAAFAMAGLTKIATPREKLADKMPWTTESTDTQVKLIGAAEVAGAIGLILPGALDIAPVLTPIAATALAALMVGAVATHLKLREGLAAAAPAIVFTVLSLFVAVERFGPHSF